MLKSLLLVVDGSGAGEEAKKMAVSLAKKNKAEITGVGVLDITWIVEPLPEPFVGTAYSIYGSEEIESEHQHLSEALVVFSKECRATGVKFNYVEEKGSPARVIEDLSHRHDLIVIGQTTEFHFELEKPNDLTVKQVVRDNPRPLVVVPEKAVTGERVLVAYDGSLQAARSLHMFLLLGIGSGKGIDIFSAHKNKEEAQEMGDAALDMCRKYGFEAKVHLSHESGDIPVQILKKAESVGAGMIVMGAFSNPIIREVLFGSTTLDLIEQSNVSLFIHH
jgi:nucleotide-binding universal stress UspA family protein